MRSEGVGEKEAARRLPLEAMRMPTQNSQEKEKGKYAGAMSASCSRCCSGVHFLRLAEDANMTARDVESLRQEVSKCVAVRKKVGRMPLEYMFHCLCWCRQLSSNANADTLSELRSGPICRDDDCKTLAEWCVRNAWDVSSPRESIDTAMFEEIIRLELIRKGSSG